MKYLRFFILLQLLVVPTSLFAATGSLTPATWDYGSVTIGSSSTKIFTLTAAGAGTLTVTSATVSAAPFTKILDGCTGISLTAGGTCTVTVQYSPTAASTSTGTLTVVTNATDGTNKISAFVGIGVAGPTVTGDLDPTTNDFGDVTIGSSSSAVFTIENTGGTSNLTITSATVSAAPFLKTSDTCTGASLPLAGTCEIVVDFNPTAATTSFGTLVVVTNATNGTTKIAGLTGTGVTGTTVTGTITPTSFSFGDVTVSSSSTTTFTIENTGGTGNLTITSATVSAAPFLKISDGCTGSSLALGETCDVEVAYNPTTLVTSAAILTVVTNATNGTNKIASFSGTGVSATTVTGDISPSFFDFNSIEVGETDSQTFTITNTGGSGSLTITSATVSAAPFLKTSDTCTGASLALAATCTIDVQFAPTVTGVFSGTLTVVTNATDGTNKIASFTAATSSPGEIGFGFDTYSFNNDIETAMIYVTRSNGDSGTVTVDYTTAPGTASETAGDYEDTSGTLTWGNGDTSPKKINITINNNSFDEDSRSFSIILSEPTGDALLGTFSIATVELFVPQQTESNSTDGSDTVAASGCAISAHRENADNSLWIMLLSLFGLLIWKRKNFIS